MDRAGGDDHLATFDLLAGTQAESGRASPFESDPVDERIAAHLEVRPFPSRLEIRVVGRHTTAVAQSQCHAADARRARARGSRHRPGSRARSSPHAARGRAAAASSNGRRDNGIGPPFPWLGVVAIVEIVLDAHERVQHLGPTPTGTTELVGPTLIVVRRAPDRTHCVHRRRPTRTSPAYVQRLRLTRTAGRKEVGQIRPGSDTALKKFAACKPAGASCVVWSGPASSNNTDAFASSDNRAASTAPAEPAPTTITSYATEKT